jgi:hypothetical protein
MAEIVVSRFEPGLAIRDPRANRGFCFWASHVAFRPARDSRHSTERAPEVASRRLWQQYPRGLRASRPTIFVMENVPQILDNPRTRSSPARSRPLATTGSTRRPEGRSLLQRAPATPAGPQGQHRPGPMAIQLMQGFPMTEQTDRLKTEVRLTYLGQKSWCAAFGPGVSPHRRSCPREDATRVSRKLEVSWLTDRASRSHPEEMAERPRSLV